MEEAKSDYLMYFRVPVNDGEYYWQWDVITARGPLDACNKASNFYNKDVTDHLVYLEKVRSNEYWPTSQDTIEKYVGEKYRAGYSLKDPRYPDREPLQLKFPEVCFEAQRKIPISPKAAMDAVRFMCESYRNGNELKRI